MTVMIQRITNLSLYVFSLDIGELLQLFLAEHTVIHFAMTFSNQRTIYHNIIEY